MGGNISSMKQLGKGSVEILAFVILFLTWLNTKYIEKGWSKDHPLIKGPGAFNNCSRHPQLLRHFVNATFDVPNDLILDKTGKFDARIGLAALCIQVLSDMDGTGLTFFLQEAQD